MSAHKLQASKFRAVSSCLPLLYPKVVLARSLSVTCVTSSGLARADRSTKRAGQPQGIAHRHARYAEGSPLHSLSPAASGGKREERKYLGTPQTPPGDFAPWTPA